MLEGAVEELIAARVRSGLGSGGDRRKGAEPGAFDGA
jgi:hypothetical protein